jgi:methylated-DNA-[protein]-cysteine S-methyltransferase
MTSDMDQQDLSQLLAPTRDELAALHTGLEKQADAAGALDVAYRTIETPVGALLLAATTAGLVRVAYETEGFDQVLGALAMRVSPRILRAPRRLEAAVRQLQDYFSGVRTDFDLALDYSLSRGFRQTVQRELAQIPYGHTRSYKDVAELVANPRAVRAVGTACATNPLPIVVPCHRVLRMDGTLGGYIGGLDVKTTLLALERAA